jgi:hypothetical protein
VTLAARTVLVAAGTSPNITYEKEAPNTFELDAKRKFFQPHSVVTNRPDLKVGLTAAMLRASRSHPIPTASSRRTPRTAASSPTTGTTTRATPATSSRRWPRPNMATLTSSACSNTNCARSIRRSASPRQAWKALTTQLDQDLLATVEDVVRLTPTIVEVIVKAPAAARHFHPGQFYRLQNFESVAPRAGTCRC